MLLDSPLAGQWQAGMELAGGLNLTGFVDGRIRPIFVPRLWTSEGLTQA